MHKLKLYNIIFIVLAVLAAGCKNTSNQLFVKLPSSKTNISFTNKLPQKKLLNILYYLYYYNGGGVAAGDINNDGLTDLFFTSNSPSSNKLYLNKGNLKFEDVTDKAFVNGKADWYTGATMVDVNNDGYLDIYVCAISKKFGLAGKNELYINNHNNTFTEKAAEYGLDFSGLSVQAAFFDYDKDGDLDCYLLNQSSEPHQNIVDTAYRNKFDSLSGDRFFINEINTNGKFTEAGKKAGIYQSKLGYGLGIAVSDLNNDGWDDIYVGNDFHENDYYYINNKKGGFTEEGSSHFGHYSRFSMGNDIADFNNDGQLDIVTADMLPPDEKTVKTYGSEENVDMYRIKLLENGYQHQVSRNCLQRNNGSGKTFSDIALMAGVAATDWSWSPLFADFDCDGNKDLLISSGIPKRPVDLDYINYVSDLTITKGLNQTDKYDQEAIDAMPNGKAYLYLFKNNGNNSFTDNSNAWGTGNITDYCNGAVYADLDNDGDLDIVASSLEKEAVVLENTLQQKNFLDIKFDGGSQNKFGIGAKVYVFTGKNVQYQQLQTARGFQSGAEPRLFFGFENNKVADSILIVWPDETMQVIKNAALNRQLVVNKKDAAGSFMYSSYFPVNNTLEKITPLISWQHQENEFNDFNYQFLIPHKQSARGPKMAVADVNEDGLDDLFVCGGKGQSSALFIQTASGNFTASNNKAFETHASAEDVDAVFFDANGDKHIDLLVTCGGNEVLKTSAEGTDRLYINDGKGNFTADLNAFPIEYESKSCIAAADVDKDGDIDFFIGHLADQADYGKPVSSYMYINNGNGKFDFAPAKNIFLQMLGMVTDACFADVNNDTWPDLVVTGEWMPIKIFLNNKGVFTPEDVPQSTGMWQSLFPADVNGDGFVDLLAGNWGHNSKLYASKNGPLKLYIKDFDNNGKNDPIMCYTINGKEYTFFAKDELEKQLPVLKKAYLKHSEVAGKTVQYLFYDLFKDYKELKAELLSSSCFINNGKGGFTRINLPEAMQEAPLMSFAETSINNEKVFSGTGNYYGVVPYEGKYDAMLPTIFSFNKTNKAFTTTATAAAFQGEGRDVKWIKTAGRENIMVVASNNSALQFYKVNKTGTP